MQKQPCTACYSPNTATPRRDFLFDLGSGLGGIALAWLLGQDSARAAGSQTSSLLPYHKPKAHRVVQIFLPGGVSQVDTFDYKPELWRRHEQPLPVERHVETFNNDIGHLMRSPWEFRQHGRSGLWMSDLLPHLATCADDLTLLQGMVAKSSNHGPGQLQMNSGFIRNGFPCLGAWLSFALGRISDNLPTFVVLPDPRGLPAGGVANWTAGFLPAEHQGVAFQSKGAPVSDLVTPLSFNDEVQRDTLALLRDLNSEYAARIPGQTDLVARIAAYNLAARMQTSIPEAVDFSHEREATKRLYGLDHPVCGPFARNCLLARRLLERGVRFVQLYQGCSAMKPRVNWDAHENVVQNHTQEAAIMDQPVAALIKDLKQRGMFDDTLLLWTTEFGRTPFSQGKGKLGRDHNQFGFTIFMAGAGLRPGTKFGATDEIGHRAVEGVTDIADFHATVLHLLGLNHERLTYRYSGRDYRLTDVEGRVIGEVLA